MVCRTHVEHSVLPDLTYIVEQSECHTDMGVQAFPFKDETNADNVSQIGSAAVDGRFHQPDLFS